MKHILCGSTLVLACVQPALALEFEFRGAEVIGTGYFNQPEAFPLPALQPVPFPDTVDDDFLTMSLGGSVEFGLGGGFFLQGDAVFQAYDMGWDNYKLGSAGTHLGYEVGSGANIGLFSYAELWDTPDEGDMSLGLEIAGESGGVFYDAFGACLFDPLNGTGWEQYHVEATGGYLFDSGVSVEFGLHYTEGDMRFALDGNAFQALAGVGYEITPDLKVEAGYVYTDFGTVMWDSWQSHGIKLALTKEIGGGTTFGQRNYLNLHNGY